MNLIDKINELRKKFTAARGDARDIRMIDGWLEEAKRLILLDNLKGHDGVKYVLEAFEGEVQKINELLNKSYSKDLKDVDRDRLLDKRDLAMKYISLFKDNDEKLKSIEDIVDSEMI